ncbi:hypothetical protein CIHG_06310 [Coccidioides immitis H538.4]|uniref:Uncharacterized protein n=2 Tax=Coccidioides immitis TaxID=5501 RepID=A0A0J8RTH1_COCIT|nr:hypothetical protein CIRG_09590 [Coccidioides immitis RMSCC 2394]KMU88510.1 hypothetical protein CIHG_06310 [Coccidioides immitis H538.4]
MVMRLWREKRREEKRRGAQILLRLQSTVYTTLGGRPKSTLRCYCKQNLLWMFSNYLDKKHLVGKRGRPGLASGYAQHVPGDETTISGSSLRSNINNQTCRYGYIDTSDTSPYRTALGSNTGYNVANLARAALLCPVLQRMRISASTPVAVTWFAPVKQTESKSLDRRTPKSPSVGRSCLKTVHTPSCEHVESLRTKEERRKHETRCSAANTWNLERRRGKGKLRCPSLYVHTVAPHPSQVLPFPLGLGNVDIIGDELEGSIDLQSTYNACCGGKRRPRRLGASSLSVAKCISLQCKFETGESGNNLLRRRKVLLKPTMQDKQRREMGFRKLKFATAEAR